MGVATDRHLGNAFKGNFDGNGKTISGLFIYRPDEDEVGLFGRVQERLVENVGLVSVNVTGRKYVGALVGYNWKGTLDSDTGRPIPRPFPMAASLAKRMLAVWWETTMTAP